MTWTADSGVVTADSGLFFADGLDQSQAGGTGSSPPKRFKRKKASEVFEEELAKIEQALTAATDQRAEVEQALEALPAEPEKIAAQTLQFIVQQEQAILRAQQREARRLEIPVYFRLPKQSAGVQRIEAAQRLRNLSRIAVYREERARERLLKIREKIDEEAAGYLMQFLIWDD